MIRSILRMMNECQWDINLLLASPDVSRWVTRCGTAGFELRIVRGKWETHTKNNSTRDVTYGRRLVLYGESGSRLSVYYAELWQVV